MLNTITTIVNAKPTVWKLQKLAETVLVFYKHRLNNNKCYTVYVYDSYVHSVYDSCGHRCYARTVITSKTHALIAITTYTFMTILTNMVTNDMTQTPIGNYYTFQSST